MTENDMIKCLKKVLDKNWQDSWSFNDVKNMGLRSIGIDSLNLVNLIIEIDNICKIDLISRNIDWLKIRKISDLFNEINSAINIE
ncbi:hypothetical protein FZX01_03740 [Listeria monocytogenes]|uniref:hypothetical protein n=1 Tax=Listeria monocytogenes TaxID=1639 RepID=UPI0011EAAC98|nr:hypothetical protein [Listeria monocytogenes]EHY0679224.1 hypothetical protein [Listeria monocytogenes]TYU88634.1 hypothetical protein FZX01_03740 [Listeria monocytogenes]